MSNWTDYRTMLQYDTHTHKATMTIEQEAEHLVNITNN